MCAPFRVYGTTSYNSQAFHKYCITRQRIVTDNSMVSLWCAQISYMSLVTDVSDHVPKLLRYVPTTIQTRMLP